MATVIAVCAGLLQFSAAGSAHETDQDDPTNPFAAVPPARYQPVLRGYRATPIMSKPGNWRELNNRAEQIGGPRGQLREVGEPIRKRKRR